MDLITSMRRGAAVSGETSELMTGADVVCPQISAGDTSWMMTATGFVLFMTPGLAFFYGGLVPRKSVVTIMMQCFISIAATSIFWAIIGFSLAFGDSWGNSGFIGNPASFPLFVGLNMCDPWPGTRIPSLLFAAYQMMFAIIAPALITGAFADRVLFPAYLLFIVLWVMLVYCPFTHWIWNSGGFLAKWGVVDFAGGIVVHISAGFAALASVFVVGPRQFQSEIDRELARVPHNRAFVALGTGMLWMGWFGFNGGSGAAASSRDSFAMVNSTLAASFAMFVWMVVEWIHTGKPQLVGACVGAVGGLATVTPAAGFVRPWAAALIGTLCAPFCFACVLLRGRLGWDDALDVWGVHGMGGLLGSLLIGVLADTSVGGIDASGLLFGKQLAACLFTLVYSFMVSYTLLRLVGLVLPLVPSLGVVAEGLDKTIHGEHAYDSDYVAQHNSVFSARREPRQVALSLEHPDTATEWTATSATGKAAQVHPQPSSAATTAAAGGSDAAEMARLREDLAALSLLVQQLRDQQGAIAAPACLPGSNPPAGGREEGNAGRSKSPDDDMPNIPALPDECGDTASQLPL